jgi:hypothetical protein
MVGGATLFTGINQTPQGFLLKGSLVGYTPFSFFFLICSKDVSAEPPG